MEHTKEPWVLDRKIGPREANPGKWIIRGKESGKWICDAGWVTEEEEFNACRIVSCVNALAGRDPGCVNKLIEALTEQLWYWRGEWDKVGNHPHAFQFKMISEIETALKSAEIKLEEGKG